MSLVRPRNAVGPLAVSRLARVAWPVGLVVIITVALLFRLSGLNWDESQHLHSDERFLSLVEQDLEWPSSVGEYFDTERSPLNPENHGDTTYAYGTLPLFVVEAVASAMGRTGYEHAFLVGRAVTAVFDAATILLVFLIGSRLWSRAVGLLAALLVALAPLHIQLAHFWTGDPYLTFFATAALYFAVRIWLDGRLSDFALCGTAVGLGLSSKATALPLLVLPLVAIVLGFVGGRRQWRSAAVGLGVVLAAGFVIFRIAQPYAFEGPNVWNVRLDEDFTAALEEQRRMTSGAADIPPLVQWAGRSALDPLRNMLLWSMGPALALAALGGVAFAGYRLFRVGDARVVLPLVSGGLFVAFFLTQFTTYARYFQPAYPALLLLAAFALVRLNAWSREGRGLRRALGAAPAVVTALALLWALAFTHVYREPHTRIEASRWIHEHVPVGSVLTFEEWDDALPLPLPGYTHDYEQIPLEPYPADSVEKVDALVRRLRRADYVVLSSDRARESIPRIPVEYPATTRYYRALDDGSLGFRLVKTIERPPQLLGIRIDDSSAEESLTVHDHPVVRIYGKAESYSEARARALLLAARPERALDVTPRSGDVNALLLEPEARRSQQRGGTWDEVFSRSGFAHEHPALAWYLTLQLLAFGALPLVLLVLQPLPDGGYALAKPLGLLLAAFPVWLGASLNLFSFSRASIAASAAALLAAGAVAAVLRREVMFTFVRSQWRVIAAAESVFAAAFVAFYSLRLANPDLWHPFRGGEKPMDVAYLTAVAKSTEFPPYDPWFAGGYLNYYYFGQFLTATVMKGLGMVPELAANVAVPAFAALAAVAAFTLAGNLVAVSLGHRRAGTSAIAAGLFAALLVVGAGNLGAVDQWLSHLDKVLGGHAVPAFDWWAPSRIVPGTAITEFPFFSYLFADLHAHVLAIPFAITTAVVALALVLGAASESSWRERLVQIALLGLLLGALGATNTWDLPTQLLVATLAVAAATSLTHRRLGWAWARSLLGHLALLVGTAWLLFLPYRSNFESFERGLQQTPETTPLRHYLLHFGILLALAAPLVLLAGAGRRQSSSDRRLEQTPAAALLTAGSVVLVLAGYALAGLTLAVLLAALTLVVSLAVLEARGERNLGVLAALGLLALGLFLTATVEVVRLSDDIGRQNTVFKFYVQAWWLFAVAGAFGAWTGIHALRTGRWRGRLPRVWSAAAALLVLAGLLYPVSAVGPRVDDRFGPTERTADGTAYMERAVYEDDKGSYELWRDRRAIDWAREHIHGSPVILEGLTPLYRWGNRFSVYTGLPAVIGWDFHQKQQRAAYADAVDERRAAVDAFYAAGDERAALGTLRRYDVRYVFVGELERAYYPPAGIAKIERLAGLERVYDAYGVQVYAVDQRAVAGELGLPG